MSIISAAQAAFTEAYGTEPAGLWAAPGRVNLIGEHTDYNDGFVLPFALPQRTIAAVGPAPDGQWSVCSTLAPDPVTFGVTEPGAVTGWGAYVAGIVWALQDAGFEVPPVRIALASDVPLGSGLSSSAALESAVLTALIDLGGLDVPLERRPAIAQRAENVYVGAPTGILDQSASIRCQEGRALFLDCRSYQIEQIPFDLDGQGLAILVINSNAPHQHVDGEYGARRKSCEAAAEALGVKALRDVATADLAGALEKLGDDVLRRRARHIITENQRVLDTVELLRAGRVREIGPLLTASHASMRDDFEITVDQVDTAVQAALDAGAHGARMTGGGFGGCVLALIDADRAEATAAAVADAYRKKEFSAPTSWVATAGPGATRL
ncbi:galactokinase [Actinoplanes derwentensis]|uniref:Galactokinase n=1 Tax=Actinoplanes derwentensis TaxID=113562 RepID=A0A1H2D183_9ACTN|nr:galactokinase [Actinoplanes derwentensis]GID85833.1 galactokinase [Actinoplanes derwentensis]SDT76319.1 galactokinase [Actinoplanes derwentensis]